MRRHILPALGMSIKDVAPLHIETLMQAKLQTELSAKTVLNLSGSLQGIFSLAVDNDLIVLAGSESKTRLPKRKSRCGRQIR